MAIALPFVFIEKEGHMQFFEIAKEMELRGMDHYLKLADSTPVREVSGLFGFLASEEKRHFDIFDAWSKSAKSPGVLESTLKENAVRMFDVLTAHFKTGGVPAISYGEVYAKALEFETRSIGFYREFFKSNEPLDAEQRAQLNLIIEQEQLHARVITSLSEFLRHPGEWIENAEFRHADDF
jgi:rubrerythrin